MFDYEGNYYEDICLSDLYDLDDDALVYLEDLEEAMEQLRRQQEAPISLESLGMTYADFM